MINLQAKRLERTTLQFFASASEQIRALKMQGHDVIRLDIGSPDLPPAAHILRALSQAAAQDDAHGYQPHNGIAPYRNAWQKWYASQFNVDLDANSEILPLLGSKEGIFHFMQAVVDPGDIVLIPDPGYLTYTQGALINGGVPYYFPLKPERNHLPDLGEIPEETARRAKILWLNYPNNPTAAVATLEFFERVVAFARSYDIFICHDAAYNQVCFGEYKAPSILQVKQAKQVAVEFNTLSKSHNMAGWRVGAALGSSQALRSLYLLKSNVDSGHFLPILEAATVALTEDQTWLAARNEEYRKRRDVVVEAFRGWGFPVDVPQASIYVWSQVPGWADSTVFVDEILHHAHVALTPGIVFGERSYQYVRVALTEPIERLEEAMSRISKILK